MTTKKLTGDGLAENCRKMLNADTVYMWGCYGQRLTNDLIARKTKQYPNRFSAARRDFLHTLNDSGDWYACDCAGLIKNYFWGGFGNKKKYSSSNDYGTEGMKRAAKKSGDISEMPETEGIVVYKKGHIGVYVGNGEVIECTLGSRGDGVVKTPLSAAGWTDWFYAPGVEYTKKVIQKKYKNVPQKAIEMFKKLITRREKLK